MICQRTEGGRGGCSETSIVGRGWVRYSGDRAGIGWGRLGPQFAVCLLRVPVVRAQAPAKPVWISVGEGGAEWRHDVAQYLMPFENVLFWILVLETERAQGVQPCIEASVY